ncbi:hypothetical protein F5Y18DRAFT_382030 [Xylariaceae sp. FL1019]|nr:hypothetical protein F5Y18DRAFT_382030 [Xylariaceae sp. FL1019]
MKTSQFAYTALALLFSSSSALKVTPNSPCVPLCVGTSADDNDPNSYGTENDDISCYDTDYATTPAGRRFESCMTCLQDSTFSQGTETDQQWFLYNLRYAFDNCIFGFPNATGVPSTPCSTSTACGGFRDALTQDDLDPNSPAYGYCDVDGADLADTSITKCAGCVAATDNESYLVNFLVALQAGCSQRPAAGSSLNLNGTVFSDTRVEATDTSSESSEKQLSLSTAAIVGIAIGIVAVVGTIAGISFVCYRKRQNRRHLVGFESNSKGGHHRPGSSLSFRCQTHLTPRTSAYPDLSQSMIEEEKDYASPYPAIGSHPPAAHSSTSMRMSPDWEPQPQPQPLKSKTPSFSRPGPKLRSLQTTSTITPTMPEKVHYSTSPKQSHFSPQAETPLSTTSNNSTSQLLPLRPYVPSEYGYSSPQIGSTDNGSFSTPTSATTSSPLLSHRWERQNQMSPVWEAPQREREAGSTGRVAGALERMGVPPSPGKGRRVSNTGSPVESKEINVYFSAPPTRR